MFPLNPQTQPAFGLAKLWFKQTAPPSPCWTDLECCLRKNKKMFHLARHFSLIKFRNICLQTNILEVLNSWCYAGFSFFLLLNKHIKTSITHEAVESILLKGFVFQIEQCILLKNYKLMKTFANSQ